MTATETTTARIQVGNAATEDVGKGVARVGENTLREIGASPGDIIEIVGKRRTAATAMPPASNDVGLEVIRLDGLERANAGVTSGDYVDISKADPKPARQVTIAPAQKEIQLSGSGMALRKNLSGRALIVGDVISTSVYQRQGKFDGHDVPEEILQRMFQTPAYGLREIRLIVSSTKPQDLVQVTDETEIKILPRFVEPVDTRPVEVNYDDVGGMKPIIEQVRETIELPLKFPELFQRLGIDPPKGILLHGPPGTGKTLLARAVAGESDASFLHIAGPEIMGSHLGESEQRLRNLFQQAQQDAPAIIFIDEIDSIASTREGAGNEAERRVVAQLLTLLDGLEPRKNVIVIAATNRVDALDEALRRPGRFDREIVIGVPDEEGRDEILKIHTRGMPLDEDVDLESISRTTYGFVGADLSALCREAAIERLRRFLPEFNSAVDNNGASSQGIPEECLEGLRVSNQDFTAALRRIQPSALREIMVQVPDIHWDDIGDLEETKTALREGVELPLKRPKSFRRLGIRPAKGFLMYGPPGTGKTLLAKAVARESEANFIAAKSSNLLSKWYGESEKQVTRLFQRARQVAPAVVFLDEIEALAPVRGGSLGEPAVTERVVNALLTEFDGLEELQGVVVIGATNRPTLIDPALLRPGRFDELIYVSLPDREGRLHILKIHTSKMPLAEDVDLESIADNTEGYTGADLEDLVRRAGLQALRSDTEISEVSMKAFQQAQEDSRASVTSDMEREYLEIAKTLKQEQPRGLHRIGFRAEEI